MTNAGESPPTCVYTAIIGDYDTLRAPVVDHSPDGIRYVCITDQAIHCPPWEIIDLKQAYPEIAERIREARRIARWFKFHPHRLFPNTNTLWIDGRCLLLGDPRRLMASMKTGVAMFAHPNRRTLWEEFGPAKGRSRCPEKIDEQKAHYAQVGCPRDLALWASGVMAHRDEPDANALLEGVWQELERFSDRDQLALPYVAWKVEFTISALPGNLSRNDWVRVLFHNDEAPKNSQFPGNLFGSTERHQT